MFGKLRDRDNHFRLRDSASPSQLAANGLRAICCEGVNSLQRGPLTPTSVLCGTGAGFLGGVIGAEAGIVRVPPTGVSPGADDVLD